MNRVKSVDEPKTIVASEDDFFVVGVGASAGGLEALSEFLSNLPASLSNAAVIIAQHLSPTYKSRLTELLGRQTHMSVVEAEHRQAVESNCVYITPPDSEITFHKGKLHLIKPGQPLGPKPSVDIFFQSLAEEKKNRCIGIILSGTGSDGSRGISLIKAAGGVTIAQEPQTAKYDGMPLAAIETGDVDMILSPDKIGEELHELLLHAPQLRSDLPALEIRSSSLDRIFRLLSKKTGTDFSNYKPSTICRRLEKRLVALKVNDVEEYLAHVEDNPDELDMLFETLLIGVTCFFRDTHAFAEIESYLRKVIETKSPGDNLRIWVAGCASGEEAYSMAILLCRLLKGKAHGLIVQIFATDIDERAIAFARKGIYPKSAVDTVPQEILDEYFLKIDDKYELIKSVRSMVLFSRHDLTKNPPFLKIDMISCRNLLIYFGTNLQKHIIPVFHYVLNHEGYLFLGKSETVGQFSDLFTTIDGKNKIFQRKIGTGLHAIKFSSFKSQKPFQMMETRKPRPQQSITDLVKETFFSTFEHPYVVINDSMEVMEVYGDVRLYLSLPQGNINTNILKLIGRDLQIELRSAIVRAVKARTPQRSQIRRFEFFGSSHFVRFIVKPLVYSGVDHHLFIVIFEKHDSDELIRWSPDLPADKESLRITELEQELTAVKEQLQTFIEELETSNEELQALNEELQAANEELQSSNEELETGNEELQATNEEMQVAYSELRTMNDVLERREDVLRRSNANTKALLNNALQCFILVDKNYRILTFNKAAFEANRGVFNKELSEGANIFDFIVTQNLPEFYKNFSSCLEGETVIGEQVTPDQQGNMRWFRFSYSPVKNNDGSIEVISISLLEVTNEKKVEILLSEQEKLVNAIFEVADIGIFIVDEDLRFTKVNTGSCKLYGYEAYEMIGQSVTMIIPPENRRNAVEEVKTYLGGKPENGEWKLQRKDGVIIDVFSTSLLLRDENGKPMLVCTTRDITESKKYRNLLIETQESVKIGGWEFDLITSENTWTEEMYLIYDVPPDFRVSTEDTLAFYIEEARSILDKAFRHAIEKGEPYDLELEMESATGRKKWVRMTCKPIRIYNKTVKLFGTLQDITGRKMAERDMENLSLVASKTSNAVIITDAGGGVEWVNDGFERITGYSLKEALGKKPGNLLQGQDTDPATVKRISEKLKIAAPFSEEILNYRKDGTTYWLKLDITPILNSKKEIVNHIAIQSDITERKIAEEELRLAKEKAEELSRLKSRFLANMSHEIRTPLNGILGISQVIAAETQEEPTRDYLKLIEESGNRLLHTINNIVDLSRLEAGKQEMLVQLLDLNPVIDRVVRSVRAVARHKGLEVIVNYEEKQLNAWVDEYFLGQIINNLVFNAIKFTEQGTITITTYTHEDEHCLTAVVRVADTGIGIGEELKARIFQPFERGASGYGHRYEGTGLGLAIVKHFTEAMGGRLSVESRIGQGSVFEVYFPVQRVLQES